MKHFVIIFSLLLFSFHAVAQSVYVDNGISISHLNKMYDENLSRYSLEMGINYLERDWFFLSSGLGYQQMGGAFSYLQIDNIGSGVEMKEKAMVKYISLNTLMNLKLENEKWLCYLGVGPSLYVNVDDDRFSSYAEAKSVVAGLKTTVGVRYKFDRMWLGVNFSYLPCFGDLLETTSKVTNFGIGLSIGYNLR